MPLAPPKFASAAVSRLPGPVRRRVSAPVARRLARFAPAAAAALAASQLTYFLCASVWHLTGRVTGAAGWLAGAAVSYALSRWAWESRGRPRVLRETLPFAAVSLGTLAVLTEASHLGYQEAAALGLHGASFGAFVQGCYLAANAVTFVVRFLLLNFAVFADPRSRLAGLYTRSRQLIYEGARFGVVGLAGLAVTDGGANLLRYQAGLGRLTSTAAATIAATAITFAGSRYWTFRHRERTGVARETALFFLVNGIGAGITEACVGLTYPLGLGDRLSYNIALLGGIALATVFRYWSYKKWVWPAKAAAPAAAGPRPAAVARPRRIFAGAASRAGELLPELGRFAIVAAFAVLISGMLYGVLTMPAGLAPLPAQAAAVIVAAGASFAGNRYWTFRHREGSTVGREGVQYLVLHLSGLVIQVACLRVGAHLLGRPTGGAVAIAALLGAGFRFWSCRTWVWRARPLAPVTA